MGCGRLGVSMVAIAVIPTVIPTVIALVIRSASHEPSLDLFRFTVSGCVNSSLSQSLRPFTTSLAGSDCLFRFTVSGCVNASLSQFSESFIRSGHSRTALKALFISLDSPSLRRSGCVNSSLSQISQAIVIRSGHSRTPLKGSL